jgi:predicted metal-dependent hydrolase
VHDAELMPQNMHAVISSTARHHHGSASVRNFFLDAIFVWIPAGDNKRLAEN